MNEQFDVSQSMTKKEIIDKHTKLLDAFKRKVKEAEQAQKLASEAEKHQRTTAVKLAQEATVVGVVENVGKLRIQIGEVLNDLTDKMNKQADTLISLNAAIEIQEQRLSELHDIEAASDSLSKIVQTYEERKVSMENEYSQRKAELETEYQNKAKTLKQDNEEKINTLKKETEITRLEWKEEKEKTTKERKREEAEYIYERNRKRKIEEDEFEAKRITLEKELKELKETREKELTEREKTISLHESELEELRKQIDELPDQLENIKVSTEKEISGYLQKEMDQKLQSAKSDHSWEKKVFDERIKHLEETISTQKEKIEELKKDLGLAHNQVEKIANKAVDGASLNKAFQSVNQIALEQARKPEQKE
ncbi:MAG: hypothetical protein P9X24_06290 [Candidatus Hatepunaea meridiana]|nr:hypothetical protein [Candidatus Hatepunaea meridiana]